jgi:hypothetical protein
MKFKLIVIALIICSGSFAQKKEKKVQFTGGARSLISHSDFTSNDVVDDTVTAPKSTGGYALIDLGIKINPNEKTEILGMFRITNTFGGFYGGGVSFDVRQVYLKGVAGDFLRYQLGNIDYKLSPYTFFNHNPDLLVSSFGTTRIKEEVLNYESFYSNNTWRQQGAAINFGLQFPKQKWIDDIDFNGFVTRINPTNLASILERLYGGGNMVVSTKKYYTLGINQVSMFDLLGTADNESAFRNNVSTITYDTWLDKTDYRLGLDGESGISSSYSTDTLSNKLTDYFVNVRAYLKFKKKDLNFELGYMDNGPDFRSFGAQSKRIDYNQQNPFYQRYTNDQLTRPLSAFDLYNDPTLFTNEITQGIMAYNPMVNNALPYGLATFNRRGFYAGGNYSDSLKIIETEAKYYLLQEIRGQGSPDLRTFNYVNGTVKFNLSNWVKWKKKQSIQVGVAYQQTNRKSESSFEQIGLNSITLNAGVELEVIKDLYILGNLFMLNSEGNETLPVRNSEGTIINFQNYSISGNETNISGGLRFDFSGDVYLAAIFESNKNRFSSNVAYQYNQLMIYYIMKF